MKDEILGFFQGIWNVQSLDTLVISHLQQHLGVLHKNIRIAHVLLKIVSKKLFGLMEVAQPTQITELIKIKLKVLRDIKFNCPAN